MPALQFLIPWLFMIVVAAVGFFISRRQENRRLKWPRRYLLYFVLAGLIQLLFWRWYNTEPGQYLYWFFELLNHALLCVISLEMIYKLLSKQAMQVVAICGLIILGFFFLTWLPARPTIALLHISIRASILGFFLSLSTLHNRENWTREHLFVFLGVFFLVFANWVNVLLWLVGPLQKWSVLFNQLSPLPGLVFLGLAGRKRRMVFPYPRSGTPTSKTPPTT